MATDWRERWGGTRVLVTGHTGFKGAWLCGLLRHLGAEVAGFALPPEIDRSLYDTLGVASWVDSRLGDIRDPVALAAAFESARPEVVLHLAAQAFVPRSLREPADTFDVNAVGTARVLDAALASPATRAVLVVTSDKVYENDERGHAFVEGDRLGGRDPYSASKAAAEIVVHAYRHSYQGPDAPRIVTARAGNVIGGGDRAPTRLLPDVFAAIEAGRPVLLRDPAGVRPWQHVLEPLTGYLRYAAATLDGRAVPVALNFGPDLSACQPVRTVVERVLALAGEGSWRQDGAPPLREAGVLRLDASAATAALGWQPHLSLDEALAWTVEWFTTERRGDDLHALLATQLDRYLAAAG